ncbi:MAG: ABC transporter ATP-binding protein [Pseudomonadota bacterium]|nr:ABC transporter ATP-binding protein [Pseudomonadota bacterium]
MTAVLQVSRIAKSFAGVQAVRDVSLAVAAGELVAMIGPNGAGKTTCFNLLNGQLAPDTGCVELDGVRIDGLPAREIARRGVARTFQVTAMFPSMTVRENVQLALLARAREEMSLGSRATLHDREAANRLLERTGMDPLADEACATLAYGDAKRLELAIALGAAPRLLLMDEPTAGMSPGSRSRLMHLVRSVARDSQIAVLFTEHDMGVVFAFADRVIVLDKGEVIASGAPAEVRADARVQAVYLGSGPVDSPDEAPAASAKWPAGQGIEDRGRILRNDAGRAIGEG